MAVGSELALTLATGGWYVVGKAALEAVSSAISDIKFASSVLDITNTGLVSPPPDTLSITGALADLFDKVVPSVSGWSRLVPATSRLMTAPTVGPVSTFGYPSMSFGDHIGTLPEFVSSVGTNQPRSSAARFMAGAAGGVGGTVAGAVGGVVVLGGASLVFPVALVGTGVYNAWLWIESKSSPITSDMADHLVIVTERFMFGTTVRCNVCNARFLVPKGPGRLKGIQRHYEDISSLQVWRAHQLLVAELRQHMEYAGSFAGVDVFRYALPQPPGV
jgi:hypothetical protein